MKFLFTSALSAFALVAPVLGAELEDRNHRYYGQQQAQAQNANVVTVHDTVVSTQFATQFITVTVGDQGAQCTQAAADALTTAAAQSGSGSGSSSGSGSGSGSNNNNNNNHNNNGGHQAQAATRTAAAHHHLETVTRTKVFTTTVTRETPVVVTETARNSVNVHTVTRTVTEHVTQTQVVTDTITVQETDFVTDQVTQTDTAAAADQTTTTTGDAGIADVNTDVVTVTDVETSTFFFTTTVDGVVATETGTTTITSDASASTSDVGGNIADVTTSNTDTSTTTSTAAPPNGTDDPQTSLTVDPRVIESAFAQDGQATPTAGQVRSLTSTNNFVNFCLTQNVPLTDGKQIRTGSCNVVPQGFIIAKDKIPSAKFVFPENFSKIPANQPFTAKLKIKNLQAGAFTNANLNYYAAPAQVNDQGILIGHSHLVIEAINGLDDTEPADPTKFAFFKGLNAPLDGDDTVSAPLASGLPAGTYRMFSINTAANHQPALASIAQHGSMDDGVYFTCE